MVEYDHILGFSDAFQFLAGGRMMQPSAFHGSF